MKEKKEKKVLRGVGVLVTILLILSVLLCVYVLVQLMSNGYVGIGKYRVFRVVTGSMEPTMSVGSLLVTKETDIADIRVDDIVCFQSYDAKIYGSVVTHRVVDVLQDDQGILLQTKGDANLVADVYYVSQENFIGKVIWYAGEKNVLTSITSIFTNKVGFLGCIVFPCLLLAGIVLKSCVNNIRNELEMAKEAQNTPPAEDPRLSMTDQEYEEMIQRIRQELTRELLQQAQPPEGEHHVGILEEEQTDTSK